MEIICKPNKKKLIISIALYSLFIVLGFLLIFKSDIFAASYFAKSLGLLGKSITIQIIGFLSAIIMSLLFAGTVKLYFQNYALILNEKGFINNTNFTNVGLILWKDIVDLKINKRTHNSLIFIYVKNKNKYYNKVKNPIIKLNILTYNKAYKASFVLETANLIISEDELFEILKKHIKR